jgi:hypothetical protein
MGTARLFRLWSELIFKMTGTPLLTGTTSTPFLCEKSTKTNLLIKILTLTTTSLTSIAMTSMASMIRTSLTTIMSMTTSTITTARILPKLTLLLEISLSLIIKLVIKTMTTTAFKVIPNHHQRHLEEVLVEEVKVSQAQKVSKVHQAVKVH